MKLIHWLRRYFAQECRPDYTALAYRNPAMWPIDPEDL